MVFIPEDFIFFLLIFVSLYLRLMSYRLLSLIPSLTIKMFCFSVLCRDLIVIIIKNILNIKKTTPLRSFYYMEKLIV